MTIRRRSLPAALLLALALLASPACSSQGESTAVATPSPSATPASTALPGMPPVTDQHNIYAAAGPNMLSDVARAAKPLVYVPHTKSRDVWVIDPATFAVVAKYPLGGGELQHVVPSWDLRTLYVSDDTQNKLTPFDPATGSPGAPIPVNQAALDSAATSPAARTPVEAAATMSSTSPSAALVFATLSRNRLSTAHATRGVAAAAATTSDRRPCRNGSTCTPPSNTARRRLRGLAVKKP